MYQMKYFVVSVIFASRCAHTRIEDVQTWKESLRTKGSCSSAGVFSTEKIWFHQSLLSQ